MIQVPAYRTKSALPATRRVRPRTGVLLAAALGASAWAGGAFAQTTRTVTDPGVGAGSLTDLLNRSNDGDTIEFAEAIRGEELVVFFPLRVRSGVTINGGGTTLNGQGRTRIFEVANFGDRAAVLRDLRLVNGADLGGRGGAATENGGAGGGAAGYGGAVLLGTGSLVLEDVDIVNARAIGGDGGSRAQGITRDGVIAEFNEPEGREFEAPENFELTGGFGGPSSNSNFIFGGLTPTGDAEGAPESRDGGDGTDGDGGGDEESSFSDQFFQLNDAANGGGGGGGGEAGEDASEENPVGGTGGDGGDGGDGGFGGGGGGRGPAGPGGGGGDDFVGGARGEPGEAGLGGVGAGDGLGDTGGGGGGLGGAIFVNEGATLTLRYTEPTGTRGNLVRRGSGGTPRDNDGQEAGAFVFALESLDLDVDVSGGASIALDASQIADLSALRDTEGFTSVGLRKTGSGTLALNRNPEFSGGLTVAGGRLAVNGDFRGNGLTVSDDGTLAGTGIVAGFTNNGRVAPGNSIGNLRVAGSYTQADDATLEVEFGGGGIDLLSINGEADLDGTVSFVEIEPGVRLLEPLTFLTAGGGVNGTFDNVEQFLATDTNVLEVDVAYADNEVTATFVPVDPDFSNNAVPGATGPIGGVLNDLVNTPEEIATLLNGINGGGLDLETIFQSQGNVLASSAVVGAQLAMTTTTNVARNRMSGVAVSARDARSLSYDTFAQLDGEPDPYLELYGDGAPPRPAAAYDGGDAAASALSRADREDALIPALWVEGVAANAEVDADDSAFGFESDTYGVSAGGELLFNEEDSLLGVFVGYTDTDTDVDGTPDSSETENLQVGLYGAHRFNDALHVNAAGSVSFLSFETTRDTPFGTARGDFDGIGVTGAAEALYDFDLGRNVRISPLVGVEASFLDRDGYDESGAGDFNLAVDGGSNEYLTHLIGAEAAIGFPAALLDWVVAVRAGWAHQYLDTSASTTSRFAAAGDSFTTSSAERDEDSFRLGAHVEFTPLASHQWTAYVRYDLDVADNYTDNAVRAGFRLSF